MNFPPVEIIELNKGDALLAEVEHMFLSFYTELLEYGSLFPITDGGERSWRKAIEPTLGRFNQIIIALLEGKTIGYAWGSLRMMPDYLGGHKIGFVMDVFVRSEYRGSSVGRQLYEKLEAWFVVKNVRSIELETFTQNLRGVAFWESLGFGKERFLMRKELSAGHGH